MTQLNSFRYDSLPLLYDSLMENVKVFLGVFILELVLFGVFEISLSDIYRLVLPNHLA